MNPPSRRRFLALIAVTLCAGCSQCAPPARPSACTSSDWTQWAQVGSHSGVACADGQPLNRQIETLIFDPFVAQEKRESRGDLVAHFQAPLVVGDDLYMEVKGGQYLDCNQPGDGVLPDGGACGVTAWNSQIWNEAHYQWDGGVLVPQWVFPSDWVPEPAQLAGWEPVFHPAVAGGLLYVPGASGSVYKIDRITGQVLEHVRPLGSDPNTYVAGPVTADENGDIYYNALSLDPLDPVDRDVLGAWLVKVPSDGGAPISAPFSSLVADAPGATAECLTTYDDGSAPARLIDGGTPPIAARPFPPGGATPATDLCLSQRPGLNIAPAVANGTVYTLSRAHHNSRYSYLVAARTSDLSPLWDVSMRGLLNDGCGVLVPSDAVEGATDFTAYLHCRIGAPRGVDPDTGVQPAAEVWDQSSSSPIVLPDGAIAYGAGTSYNGSRGHLMKFSATGAFLGSYDFGWDVTPASFAHDGTYSLVTKDNHYVQNVDATIGPFFITQLSANLEPEWKASSPNGNSCTREADQTVHCNYDHDAGFEWCINNPAVDRQGHVYVNSEDGRLYQLDQGGAVGQSYFLLESLGAAYTPLSIDDVGRIYSLNAGQLSVIGR